MSSVIPTRHSTTWSLGSLFELLTHIRSGIQSYRTISGSDDVILMLNDPIRTKEVDEWQSKVFTNGSVACSPSPR